MRSLFIGRGFRGLGLALLFFATVAASPAGTDGADAARSPLLSADGAAVPLSRLQVEATIVGFLAQTTTTMTFRNDSERDLEGALELPLPEGATVSGYALDVAGAMAEGVAVEQQAARVAFETEERRRVDPGLVEAVRGNTFRTRVWPIRAGGTRTVRVSYVSELAVRGGEDAAVYALRLPYDAPVADFSLRIEVVAPAAVPDVRSSAVPGLRFARARESYVAEARGTSLRGGGDVRVTLPDAARAHVSVERDEQGAAYFVVDDFPQDAGPAAPRDVHRISVFWDASLSRAKADTARERALLARWLASYSDVDVRLTVFRNAPESPRTFRVQGGDAQSLLAYLEHVVVYDGGTSFAGVDLETRADVVLLFSDGLHTLAEPLRARPSAPLYALSSSAQADHGVLRRLAEGSGGAYIDLLRQSEDEAMALLRSAPFALLSVDAAPGTIGEVMPGGVRPIVGRVTVAGRLLSAETSVTLRYGRGTQVSSSQTFTVRRSDATRTGLVPRFWAQQKAAVLALDPALRPELVALGRRFGLVTPATSLLVLETLDQHLTHQIPPPKSRPEMRAEYMRHAAEAKRARVQETQDKLERVAAEWQQHLAWWRRDFRVPLPTPKPRRVAASSPSPTPTRPPDAPPAERSPSCTGFGGEVHGVATDSSGAPLPGTRVTVTHAETGVALFTESGGDGGYRLCGLGAGEYQFRGEMLGFKSFAGRVRLRAGGVVSMAVVMELGTVTESIEVMAVGESDGPSASTITIREWDPDTPYLAALESVPPAEAYRVYLQQRDEYGGSPAFFLDCAGFFYRAGAGDMGLRVLTSILELKLDEPRLLRVVAHRLQQAGELDLAIALFERVAELRPEEPHSARDIALALAARADRLREAKRYDRRRVAADYTRALARLNDVVLGHWDGRFDGIEMVALMEANRLIAILERERLPGLAQVALDPRLRGRVDVDLRIVLTWDTDGTDMDLWVTEPSGEKCDYGHNLTRQGGRLSRDLRGGYGPEEYSLRRAAAGAYGIEADYYGSDSASILGPTTVQATIVTDYGRRNEKRESVTLRLADESDVVTVGTARFQPPAP
jgi:Ca-activated chloride channel homolog